MELVILCFTFPCVGLGYIIQGPVNTSAPMGVNATFRCEAIGNIFWSLVAGETGLQIQSMRLVDIFADILIFFPLSKPSPSEMFVTATSTNNGTTVQCSVEEFFGSLAILNTSEQANLLVYGEFSM